MHVLDVVVLTRSNQQPTCRIANIKYSRPPNTAPPRHYTYQKTLVKCVWEFNFSSKAIDLLLYVILAVIPFIVPVSCIRHNIRLGVRGYQ